MKRLIYACLLFIGVSTWQISAQGGYHAYVDASDKDKRDITQLKEEIKADLTGNILHFWAKYAPDPAGGFYGQLNYDGSPRANAPKAGILNARILWTFSSAYRLLGDEQYKQLADRAQRYILDHFVDKKYGGTYLLLKADGTPLDSTKMVYQNAFAIYGLSEHYRATGNAESLQAAIAVYQTLIKYAYDPVYKGFIETCTREWKEIPTREPKTMNTNLHVLEALTNLYRVWKDEGLREMLREEIDVMANKVLNRKTWHEQLYFTNDWQSLRNIDSYGHDIEYSWLMTEAAEVLGNVRVLEDIRHVAVNMAEVQLQQGFDKNGGMMYEKDGEHLNNGLEWWPQAESVVGYLNAWQISGERKYLDTAIRSWNWIKKYMIDKEYGEWYRTVSPDGTPSVRRPKADQWRCPYHNSRMGFEVLIRFP
ncbi:MAG: AGE family epimerase/isomerase [Prevotellaceae bacterium]|jgi:mannobiose 2-epimerase|nr:AGE family epimerase/isomerase [Prevotellaceae bacterium]